MSMAYQIEKSIPVPAEFVGGRGKRNELLDTLDKLEPGDSFCPVGDEIKLRQKIYTFGKRHKKRFTARKQPNGTLRCWRVA